MTNRISILGSTGSIGRQTLDVAEQMGLQVEALTAHSSVDRMEAQARQFKPRLAVMTDQAAAKELAIRLSDTDTKVLGGFDALCEAATAPEADTVVTAVVGMVGLKPTLAAIREKKRIALANKETLVCAGQLVMDTADQYGAAIIPVDSEHSAIFQCVQGCADRNEIKRLILTCSGGPFFGMSYEEVGKKTRADALKHPNWAMGPKITVDSATLMNKGFEVIEAAHLFGVPADRIKVVVHRESIIHSMVEYIDNSIIAQMSVPDMRLCVQYALTAPHRTPAVIPPLDLLSVGKLTFAAPDEETFPFLAAARNALAAGGAAPAALNAANEVAVSAFLARKISMLKLFEVVLSTVADIPHASKAHTLSEILDIDREARERAAARL